MANTIKRKRADTLSAPVPYAIQDHGTIASPPMEMENAKDPQGMAMVKMAKQDFDELAEVSKATLEVHGTIRLNTGTILVMQSTLISVLNKVRSRLDDEDDAPNLELILKAANSLAKVGNTIAKLASEQKNQTRPAPMDKPKRNSLGFEPGQKVIDVK